VPDKNGAGIRQEGAGLTVRNCFFHDNEDGILTGADPNQRFSPHRAIGVFTTTAMGMATHIICTLGISAALRCNNCFKPSSKEGHNIKVTPRRTNYILYNRISMRRPAPPASA